MVGFTTRPAWADEYPDFYNMIMSYCGDLQEVDEFNVPFYSNLSYVTVKRSHPIFCNQSPEIQSFIQFLDPELRKGYDSFNKQSAQNDVMASACSIEGQAEYLRRSPVCIRKEMYIQSKTNWASFTNGLGSVD